MKNELKSAGFLTPIRQKTPNRIKVTDIGPSKATIHCHHNTIPVEDTKFRSVYTANGKASYTKSYQEKPMGQQTRNCSRRRGHERIVTIQKIYLPQG